uniref:SWIM-type domain-containing protein n=1 Tax=Setaria viridis TaxID=4556 RepID=A0A4U6VVZ2_SETVI|nr:hypothetical protein SEVIR_2G283900v2 [Setaria viridis]
MGVLADFHGRLGNLTFSSKDVSNMRTHLRGGVTYRDMDATLEYFQKQQAESSSLYYATMIDDNNVVRGLFWVDGRTRELYKRFGDCIFFDTTYCTNRYDMPFVPIVGINNHLHSILLGAERENKECCKGEILDAPLWGRYAFEKQAAAFYTGEVFELLRDSTRYKVGAVESDDQGWSIQIVHPNSTRVRMVTIDKDATSYTCSCNMFDRDGLLCPHILKVFTNRDVEKISEKYLLRRWSKEVTIMIPERLSGTESAFGVPTTNKLRYNTLCRKMTSLAVEACLGHEQYIVASAGIDTLVQAVRTARGSQEMQQNEASNVATSQQSKTPAVMVKNPTRTKGKGRPKEKVERFKSIVAQAKEKAMKKKAKGKKTAQKIPPCSYCFEDDHSVQTCAYMAKTEALAKDLKETELKL